VELERIMVDDILPKELSALIGGYLSNNGVVFSTQYLVNVNGVFNGEQWTYGIHRTNCHPLVTMLEP